MKQILRKDYLSREGTRSTVFETKLLPQFENSPLRFEYEVLLEEFRATRAELNLHVMSLHEITNYELIFLAALVSLGPSLLANSQGNIIRLFLLGGSIVFSAFALLLLWHDTDIAYLAGYISAVIKPRLESILNQVTENSKPVLLWEEFISMNRTRKFPNNLGDVSVSVGHYALAIVPCIGLFIAGFAMINPDIPTTPLDKAVMALASFGVLLVVIAMIYVVWIYVTGITAGHSSRLRMAK